MSDIDGALVQPAISNSGEVDTLLIEKFTGKVQEVWEKTEGIMGYFDYDSVKGTNTISNKYLGDTELVVLQPGQDPEPQETEFDKNALVVDTIVLGRNYVQQLHDVQNDIEGLKSKLAKRQNTKLIRLEDEMLIQQMIYGANLNTEALRTNPRVSGHGFSVNVAISDDQAMDPYALLGAIEEVQEQMILQEMEVDETHVILPWTYFNILKDGDHILNKDYEIASGSMVSGFVLKSFNTPVLPSNRFPKALSSTEATGHHKLSKASNQYRYDVIAAHLTCVAVIFTPEALLTGYTLELQGDIWFHKGSKGYFIDTWLSEGAIPDRWEAVGIVNSGAGSDNATVASRAARKAQITRAVTLP